MSKIDGHHEKRGRGKEDSPLQISEEGWPYQHLDFGLLASKTVRQYISAVFTHSTYGTLLQKPKETNIGSIPSSLLH